MSTPFDLITPEMEQVLRDSASMDPTVSHKAMQKVIAAIQLPLNQAVMAGDIIGNVFTVMPFKPGVETRFPLDFVVPGTESTYSAYTMPNTGYIPEKNVDGDYVVIPTYKVAVALDWAIQYAEDARWDVMAGAKRVLEAMLTRKINYDGWRTIVGAGYDRSLSVTDPANTNYGFLTKRLVSLMKLGMRRYGGGNSATLNQPILTDLFMSPECMDDIRNWDLTQLDDVSRRQIYVSPDGAISQMFGVNLHELFELGESQMLQNYYATTLGASMGSYKEIVVGISLAEGYKDKFVMPMVSPLKLYDDAALQRQMRQGLYGWQRHGFGVCDNRAVLIGKV